MLGLFLSLMSFVFAQPAQAADAIVQVVMDSFLPIVPTTGADLNITGRVVNSSTTTVTNPSVQLRLSPAPVLGRGGIDRESSAPTAATRTVASVQLNSSVAPNAQMSFKFSLPFQQLSLNRQGVYALAIDVVDAGQIVGSIRTFLPWYPSEEKSPHAIGVVWLWPLADYPARTATNVLLNNQTPTALSPGGRLTNLVSVGREFSSTLSWMIDPSLVQTADALGRGYQVVQDGEVVVGNRSTDASRWLDELRSSISSSNAHALAYADIDAVADRKNGLSADVVRAITVAQPITSTIVKSSIPGGMYWAPNGQLDQKTANLLASAGTTTAVLSTAAMAGDTSSPRQGVADYETTFGNINAVLTDQRLSSAIALPQRNASEMIVARQRFLAETAAIADSPAALVNAPLTVVAAPLDLRWAPSPSFLRSVLRATQVAPWMIPTTLESLLNSPRGTSDRLPYVAGNSELTRAYLGQLKVVQSKVGQLTAVQQTPGPVKQAYAEALVRAQSAAWRTEPGTGAALLTAISSELNTQIDQVRPISSGTITFSGDAGNVPVTLANDSDSVVNVGLSLIGVPSSRLESVPKTGIVIEPGQKISLEIPVRIVGGDPLPTKVQLLTPKGQAYGTSATIVLGSTAYARAAGWVVVAAFGAIAIFVVVGITRRIVQARKSDE
jgi:Family of unknown function (DUF6049)